MTFEEFLLKSGREHGTMEQVDVVKSRRRVLLRTPDRELWYVLAVEFSLESFVQNQVRRLGYQTCMPLLLKKYGNGTVAIRPLFPGYLLVQFNVVDVKWRELYRIQGVSGILGWGDTPSHVPTRIVRKLIENASVTPHSKEPVLLPGELVRICDGSSMDGFDAQVTATADSKVKVSFLLFGKLTEHVFRLDEVRRLT